MGSVTPVRYRDSSEAATAPLPVLPFSSLRSLIAVHLIVLPASTVNARPVT